LVGLHKLRRFDQAEFLVKAHLDHCSQRVAVFFGGECGDAGGGVAGLELLGNLAEDAVGFQVREEVAERVFDRVGGEGIRFCAVDLRAQDARRFPDFGAADDVDERQAGRPAAGGSAAGGFAPVDEDEQVDALALGEFAKRGLAGFGEVGDAGGEQARRIEHA
jgi:hypothetical protein